jgi:tetratricopeptide (TPR) repeat protein
MFGVWVAGLIAPAVSSSRIANAQPSSGSAHAGTSARTAAKKLVDEGNAAYNAKDYGKAIALYMRAFSLEPHPRLLFNVGQALRLAGCSDRATSFYERYLALEPNGGESEPARGALAEIKGRRSSSSKTGQVSTLSERCSVADDVVETSPAAPMGARGRLKLSSTPEGLLVMIDGVKIGATPTEHEVATGAHMVSLVHRGQLVGEQKVEVGANAVVEVSIPVRLTSLQSDRTAGGRRLAPVLLWVGGGIALAGSGVAFYYGQKGWPEDNYSYRGANETGFALAGAGLAAVGIGTWLWLRGSSESAPIATVDRSGAYLGWNGSF